MMITIAGQSSFQVTISPKLHGIYESTRAKVKYINGAMIQIEGVEIEFREGYSTSLGRMKIISAEEYERASSYHLREWILFALFYSIPTLIPFLLWRATKAASYSISLKKRVI